VVRVPDEIEEALEGTAREARRAEHGRVAHEVAEGARGVGARLLVGVPQQRDQGAQRGSVVAGGWDGWGKGFIILKNQSVENFFKALVEIITIVIIIIAIFFSIIIIVFGCAHAANSA
jgi:hypothetical protein